MEQKRTLSKWLSARRYIREFAADYAERYAEDPAEIERDIIAAKKQNHISLNEYEWVGYHERTEAQKRTMSTLWTRAEFRKTYTDRRYIAILMNKYIFSKVFADFYGRRCVQASDVDAALLESLAGDCGKVVYKPNCKGQGTGVRVLGTATEQARAETLAYLRANPGGIVEEYIQQHPTLAQLNPGAVSIVRFYTVTAPSGTYLFAPVLTAAIEKDISNGWQDALTAMIDIRTGVVLTDAVDQNNCIDYHAHPVTGVAFPGLQLPFWDETIDMMRRAVPLARINAISQSQLDQYTAQYKAAEATVRSAEQTLSSARMNVGYTELRSPIDGIISNTSAHVGDYVGPGTQFGVLTTISNIDTLTVDVAIPMAQYLRSAGPRTSIFDNAGLLTDIRLMLADGTEYPYEGLYDYTRKDVSSTTGTLVLVVMFPNPDRSLKPGQFARVEASVGPVRPRVVVPQACVSQAQGVNSVWVVRPDSTAMYRRVIPGDTYGSMWCIDEGLIDGELVVTAGQQKLHNGMKVIPEKK